MSEKILGVLRNPLTIASAGYMALGLAAAGLTKFIHVHDTAGMVFTVLAGLWIAWAATYLTWRRL